VSGRNITDTMMQFGFGYEAVRATTLYTSMAIAGDQYVVAARILVNEGMDSRVFYGFAPSFEEASSRKANLFSNRQKIDRSGGGYKVNSVIIIPPQETLYE
jgi:hypothetical protein